MEFTCSLCDYTSEIKSHVTRHQNNKNKCGDGILEIIEVPIDISCEFCNKTKFNKAQKNM